MRFNHSRATIKTAVFAVMILLLTAGVSFAQQVVNLAAAPTTTLLPDGSSVPMWGYSCGAVVSGSTATCSALNSSASGGWSPVVITVPTGQTLQINLTNNLTFANGNSVPTSLVIVGQLGGGLGSNGASCTDSNGVKHGASCTPSPTHGAQTITWPAAGNDATNTPPPQGPRVQSFATEVAAGVTTSLTWDSSTLRPGTYLIESGTHPSIQGSMGLYGILVVTAAPSGSTAGTAYPGVNYNSEVSLLMSEIDPIQNRYVADAVNTAGFSETAVWSGQPGACGDVAPGAAHTCYPPVVNYTPLYYLINGVAFNKTSPGLSVFPTVPGSSSSAVTGTVLVRLVNAGLRMHVPSIVGSKTTVGSTTSSGFSLIAEDGNPLPGVPRVQSEVFMAAGKTYDVKIDVPASGSNALPVYDRELSLSGNATSRDAGMLAYIGVNGSTQAAAAATAVANTDTYNSLLACAATPCPAFTVSDSSKGVLANDINVTGAVLLTPPTHGTLTLNADGTFSYVPSATGVNPDSFVYQAAGMPSVTATVTLGAAAIENATGITVNDDVYPASNVATTMTIKSPGVLVNDTDGIGYKLKVAKSTINAEAGLTVDIDESGSFTANASAAGTYHFTYRAQNSQGTYSGNSSAQCADATTASAGCALVTLTFPAPSNLVVNVIDGLDKSGISDYRWIIEEDRTFHVDPSGVTQGPPSRDCSLNPTGCTVPTVFGANFHTSYMPVIADGCTGAVSCESGQSLLGTPAVCDQGNGVCRTDGPLQKATLSPAKVALDPAKHYYISVLPGDAMGVDGAGQDLGHSHAMGGAQISFNATTNSWNVVNVIVEPMDLPPAKVTVFVFEDDFPLNGEHDANGGVDTLAPLEAGLGGFNITLFDDVGGSGDAAGQMTYDMSGQPLANALAGTKDPTNGNDACPISKDPLTGLDPDTGATVTGDSGITGVIPVCPTYESDGSTLSPLAGQAVVANLPPGRYGVVATPGADRIARGEEWLQTNTLDGGKAHDSFIKVNEPAYFQEYGPAGYHVTIGFANPDIINKRKATVCADASADCTHTVDGTITGAHMSRTPDERLYSSGTRDTFGYSQCYVSLGSPDGGDFAFAKCKDDGTFTFTGIPYGDWRITVFDQWNDQVLDGISTPVRVNDAEVHMGDVAVHQWKSDLYTRTFFDANSDGLPNKDLRGQACTGPNTPAGCNPNYGNDTEEGLSLVPTNVRYRDGSFSNFNSTDLNGYAGFNEVFPLFNWYVVETDSTRYKNTGTHVVYDAGGPVDNGADCGTPGYPTCGTSTIGTNMARTVEDNPLPGDLHVPGSVYCNNADCTGQSIADGPNPASTPHSTGRIDAPWVTSYGWQGFIGQNSFLEFGKKPYAEGENGGIRGHVVYASTRPFDDPSLLLQLSWEPMVPNVTINLYQEGTGPDGSQTLKLVDTTKTSSWDDWAQGFRSDNKPNMSCPGQSTTDLYYYTLYNQPYYLNASQTVPYNSQFKCFDGMHNWNQLQPAPYDGMYSFPSVAQRDPVTGKVTASNCTICSPNHAVPTTDWNYGEPMLPAGKYVVEMIVPPGYELVKEEDKNILMGDTYVAPVAIQFAGFGNIFIMPDQAEVAAAYNQYNTLIPTTNEGVVPRHEGDTGSVETFWPCVGAERIVPDYMSLFPGSGQNAPFAGAKRPLCDRKEVTLEDQMSVLAKFYVFTSTHVAAHFTGLITDDLTAEFDPFSPSFGEKFAPPNMPVGIKDWAGNEVARVYSDQWGAYNGLNYSSWGVNPPDPSGYVPTMMVTCMNDAGDPAHPDPAYQPAYSQFCYETPFMPGQTQYMDTPVVPTSAFAGAGYNNPDCAYPEATPAIASVTGDTANGVTGPWVSQPGNQITIKALTGPAGMQVYNYGYSGPSAANPPFNQKTIARHYGFGSQPGTVELMDSSGLPHPLTGVSWSDDTITGFVPPMPACDLQQQAQYGGPGTPGVIPAQCGQLVIITADGKQSVDTVTVTIGGKAPIAWQGSIQATIDSAKPGDLILVPAGSYNEMVVMWKPVRLQGVGAASSVINSTTHPSGQLLDPWRKRILCLFGLGASGTPSDYDSSCGGGWAAFQPASDNPQIDRLPLEATVGWDATLNGNLAESLQEPTLLGAYEGAGITVLAKGVHFPTGSQPFAADTFPDGTQLLVGSTNATIGCGANGRLSHNPFPSNFYCNPSRIDGLTITNASQGGGGIFIHAWAHNLEVSNNRVVNNLGSLAGGITVGQGEHPDLYLGGTANAGVNTVPGSCVNRTLNNAAEPYCFDRFVNIHNNAVVNNSSLGDELFSSTPAGAGGVSIANGSDGYKFQWNWVCGNLSTGDGGGVSHIGYSEGGLIEHNTIIFNQTTNPTISTNGGGLLIMGAPDADPTCVDPFNPDADCHVPTLSDGTGNTLTVNANLILGNAADSGAGGGIRLQATNGTDVQNFPTTPGRWNKVTVTNNIIANNVAGWDGGGASLQDALNVDFINNTIVDNDTTSSAGELFTTFRALANLASGSNPGQLTNGPAANTSVPQPAGIASSPNSDAYSLLTGSVTCPGGHGTSGPNATCKNYSIPRIQNDIVRGNRSFYVGVGALDTTHQQNVVKLFSAFSTANLGNQAFTGDCISGTTYWDIGVRGDRSPTTHESGITLAATTSVTSATGDPSFTHQYCNGSRIPPEFGGTGYQVPPGTNEANATPLPLFNLGASATVDEGNNWVNVSWGPLSLVNPSDNTNTILGNYTLTANSSAAINRGNAAVAPLYDFFGNLRNDGQPDIGAVEFKGTANSVTAFSAYPTSLDFGNWATGTNHTLTVTVTNYGNVNLLGGTFTIAVGTPFTRTGGTCAAALNAGASCTINVRFAPTAVGSFSSTLTVHYTGATDAVVNLTGTGVSGRATTSISPNPLTITLPSSGTTLGTGTGVVVFTNSAAAGGSSLQITNVAVSGGSLLTYFFNIANNGCSGATLAPGDSCAVTVRFNNVSSPKGVNRTGTITFTDNGLASPQTGNLVGFYTP
jgi:hypothetical protein